MLKLKAMRVFLVILFLFLPLFFSQANEILSEQARTYREEGYKLQTVGNFEGALGYYQKAAQMDPNFYEVYNDIGVVFEAMGDDDSALAMYKKALNINPGYLPGYTNLAFLYERKGDIENATLYWTKRYEAGEEGGYWWEVSKQHLLKLGTYPQVRQEVLEREAAKLSRELIYQNEQKRLKSFEEAQLHFDVGNRAFIEGDYEVAVKEFMTVLYLNPPDEDLKNQTRDLYAKAERLYLRSQALVNTQNALDYINNGDYPSAGKKLKDALSAISSITRKD